MHDTLMNPETQVPGPGPMFWETDEQGLPKVRESGSQKIVNRGMGQL